MVFKYFKSSILLTCTIILPCFESIFTAISKPGLFLNLRIPFEIFFKFLSSTRVFTNSKHSSSVVSDL